MGTSQGYGMPTGGDWTSLKNEATRFVKGGSHASVSAGRLLSDYLKANGGASSIARGNSGSGSRGHSGGAARGVGRNLGSFLASVGAVGLEEALREIGQEDLIGKPAEDVIASLLDALSVPGSTLDEHAARLALAKLNDELLKGAETYEDVGRLLSEALDQQGLLRILVGFFGHYLYERFCRDFYETWIKKVGSPQAARSLKSIKDCIWSSLKAKLITRDIAHINWRSKEGLKLTEGVMEETLEIFEVLG